MNIKKMLLGAFVVATISVVYNFIIFFVFDFYPDEAFLGFLNKDYNWMFLVIIFVKNMVVGLIMMILYNTAYSHIQSDRLSGGDAAIGIIFFVLYAIFTLLAFTIGDMLLMRSYEGMLLLVTVDGFIEAFIATIPIRIFAEKR